MKRQDDSRLSARGKAAAVALADLQKAVRFFRLYPHEHPLCKEIVGEALEKLARFLDKHGALELEVQREGVLLDEELVLRDSEQSTDLSALLHPEGIRELSIDPGIDAQELGELVRILSAHYPEGEELSFTTDLLTELWKTDLPHIEYRIFDQLAPTSLKGAQRDASVAPVAERIDDLVDELAGKKGAQPVLDEQLTGLDVDRFLAELEAAAAAGTLDDVANWATKPEQVEVYLASPEGAPRRRLLLELGDPVHGDPLGRAMDSVVWALPRPEAKGGEEDVARFVAGATLAALGRGEVEAATATLARLPAGPEAAAVSQVVSARLGSEQGLGLLATALETRRGRVGEQELTDIGQRYLSYLDGGALPAMCQVYPTVGSEVIRRVFREYLSSRVEQGAEAIASMTLAADRTVAEEAAQLLASAGRGSEAWRLLERAADDGMNAVASAVARDVLDTVTGEKLRRERVRVVQRGPDKAERMAALEALAPTAGPRLFEDLLPTVHDHEFPRRDEDEVEAVLELLVRSGGLRSVRALQELAQRRTLIFGRKEAQRASAIAQRHLDALKRPRGGPA